MKPVANISETRPRRLDLMLTSKFDHVDGSSP
jgi:hypothetical protein